MVKWKVDGGRLATIPTTMRFFLPSAHTFRAFTLVELLIALSLSLILLLAMTELFSRVGGVMNDTRTALNMTTNLDGVEYLLRQDLARIPATLPAKPKKITDLAEVNDQDGYLEITEGPDTLLSYPLPDPPPHPYVNEDGLPDPTVGDVDDILGFTAIAEPGIPFRGLKNQKLTERNTAEIAWFVRGNTLYRRVIILDDGQMEDLADRQKRFGHDGRAAPTFPYPMYPSDSPWQYLRMPTIEEFYHKDFYNTNERDTWFDDSSSAIGSARPTEHPDLWNQPYFFPDLQDRKSGSLKMFVNEKGEEEDERSSFAGEDIVLTNVLSFDIKVWDPETKDFVDLGAEGTQWDLDDPTVDPTDTNDPPKLLKPNNQPELNVPKSTQPKPWRIWDSWTRKYKQPDNTTVELPPYSKPLTAVRFTIRCFDPASRGIKQISVVHRFEEP